MPAFQTLIVFLGAALALNLTPGPDMLYVAARGSGEGRRAGIVSALGIAAGCTVHITALALGLSALLAAVPLAYEVIRWAGAAYLIWLGVRALLRPAGLGECGTVRPAPTGAIFRQGVITNVLNPKVALFFLAFLPQFVDPARGSPAGQIVALGMLFNTSGTLVNLGVGWLRRRDARTRMLQRVTGAVFVGLGLRLAAMGRR